MTDHADVVTRWYRAPEILLKCSNYTKAVDVWSVGCIFAEMLGRSVLFQGRNYVDQLKTIISVLGKPTDELILEMGPLRPDAVLASLAKLPERLAVPFDQIFPKANPEALDLLQSLLVFEPARRLEANQALHHKYLSKLVGPMGVVPNRSVLVSLVASEPTKGSTTL